MGELLAGIAARRRLVISLQVGFVALLLGFLGWALRDTWGDALPRLRDADLVDLSIACLLLAAYYLMFVIGWQWILRALGIRTSAGIERTSVVVASILLEAGLSAVAGVLVLVCALPFVEGWDAPIWPVVLFGIGIAGILHPRVYRIVARFAFRPFGAEAPPALPWSTMIGLVVFYSANWILGGFALLFLVRSVGGDAGPEAAAYLGGTAAVGAIVAVLSVLAPSGLGVREASMYGLLLAVASPGVALGATVLNRLAITVVEAGLLGTAVLAWRRWQPLAKAPSRTTG
jgi:uncharacterized membrane protein YbhN (UPF0104 family)